MELTKSIIDEIPTEAYDILNDIGYPASSKGYDMTAYAIYAMATNTSMMTGSITKELYPTVASKFNSTSTRVERCIRHCIEVVFERADIDTLNKYFGSSIDSFKGKLTNSEFLSRLARILRNRLIHKIS